MKRLLIVILCLLSIAAAPPEKELVSSCNDFDTLLNGQGESRPAAYEYFIALKGTPAYFGDPIPDQENFWQFEGLLYDLAPQDKKFVFGAFLHVREADKGATHILTGWINPDRPEYLYLLIFDAGAQPVTLCGAYLIDPIDMVILTALSQ